MNICTYIHCVATQLGLSDHRLYMPYVCETAARAQIYSGAHCLYARFALLKFSFVNDTVCVISFEECIC